HFSLILSEIHAQKLRSSFPNPELFSEWVKAALRGLFETMNKLLLSKTCPRRTGVRLAHDLKAADPQAYSMPECYKKKLKSSWLTNDNYVYKEYSFPPFEIPPHPRAMIEPFTSTAKLRNSPWRFIWEHNNQCRYFVYLGPFLIYLWYYLLAPCKEKQSNTLQHA
uniref:Uncharacterized protein n=1 Tax=Romanomermis culicivorax TaxID=13658 RepID=A0A915JQ51_ROMCU